MTLSNSVFLLILFFAISGCSKHPATSVSSHRTTSDFNEDWRFSLEADSSAIDASFDDKEWRTLDLPHDWSIEGPFSENAAAGVGGGALPGGTGWYRKRFLVPAAEKDKKIFIRFDGIYCNSDVWINGHHAGYRPNGYISFVYDLTSRINFDGSNVITVRVDNSKQPNSRWYSGSGIYRNVWLISTDPVYIDHWGTYVTTPQISESQAEVNIETKVVNSTQRPEEITIQSTIIDKEGNEVSVSETTGFVSNDSSRVFSHRITLKNPKLWTIEDPYLFRIISQVRYGNRVADTYETPLGIRAFNFDPQKGFSLNDKPLKILGVCNHHDLGCLGAAINTRALQRQLEIMKGMGVNAIRTSHNPPAPELLELCDQMGFIVMDEMFDMWKKKKTTYDYSTYWDNWHKKDLEDFIRRDRNHPSVMIWSIGNEIGEQWDSTGNTIARELASIVRNLDNTRPITTANNEVNPFNNIIKSGALDLIGYNYNHKDYSDFPKRYPGKKFIATETTSALATRGHYDMPSDSIRRWPIAWDKPFTEGNKDNTVSSYDNVSAPWGSTHEETWKIIKRYEHLSGMFIWTGFDYLGEPTPYVWPSRSSYFGVVDLAGFPKDSYFMYQSEWTDQPVLHVFPHWNWPQNARVDVWAYYNQADEAELFLNGVSMGIKRKANNDLHVVWPLKFEPGTLRVVTRKQGKEVLVREVRTAGAPAKIVLAPDRKVIKANGRDLSFVTVTIFDKDGNVVPDASNRIMFELVGDAKLAAVDNGDPTSHESFQSNSVKAFHGLCLAVIKGGKKRGEVTFKASSPGLEEASLILQVE